MSDIKDLLLIGGTKDGGIIKQDGYDDALPFLSFDSDTFLSETKNNGFIKQKGERDHTWCSFSRQIYINKGYNKKHDKIVFKFKNEITIYRCSAKTVLKKRCNRYAIKNEIYCSLHNK